MLEHALAVHCDHNASKRLRIWIIAVITPVILHEGANISSKQNKLFDNHLAEIGL
jgi:hypothetical protein